jgi:hypothetical protein
MNVQVSDTTDDATSTIADQKNIHDSPLTIHDHDPTQRY